MDISKVDSSFSEDTEPCDDKLMSLLKQAYSGEIKCKMAIVDIDLIQPFSDYKATAPQDYYDKIIKKFRDKDETPPALFVYADNGKFIMSDDYISYGLYKGMEFPHVRCVIIGSTPKMKGVEYFSKPFILPPPTIGE